jgi:hypothetical protein
MQAARLWGCITYEQLSFAFNKIHFIFSFVQRPLAAPLDPERWSHQGLRA